LDMFVEYFMIIISSIISKLYTHNIIIVQIFSNINVILYY